MEIRKGYNVKCCKNRTHENIIVHKKNNSYEISEIFIKDGKTIIQLKSEDTRQVQYYLKPQRNGDYVFNDYFLIKESRKEKMKKIINENK